MNVRPQSRAEELANSVVHGVALLVALVATPILIDTARHPGVVNVIGAGVFAATMVLLYSTSTLYHALPSGRAKRVLLRLDLAAIYLFIAGSYTPFALGDLSGPMGWTLFGLVWLLAAVGVTLKAIGRLSHASLSTGLYIAMGWLVLIAAIHLVQHMPVPRVALLVAGGLAYTGGVAFFVLDSRFPYAHAIWHGFVVVGTGFHFVAALNYAP
jgi:hemolysin III